MINLANTHTKATRKAPPPPSGSALAVDEVRFATDELPDFEEDLKRAYVARVTVQRLHQQSFRRRVLRAYRERCSVCRLKHAELLDAAHILPDVDPRGDPVVANGLALCKLHHAAYDRHILGVTPDCVIEIRRDILEEVDGPMLQHGLKEMDGVTLYVPRSRVEKPRREFLGARYEVFRKAG